MVIFNPLHHLGFTSLKKCFILAGNHMSLVLISLQRPSFKESQSVQGCGLI